MKENNIGITLIALIITVIVMLLLVGVSIYGITNFGLITRAGQVKNMYDNSYSEGDLSNVTGALHNSITGATGGIVSGNVQITPSTTNWTNQPVIIYIETITQVNGYELYYKTDDVPSWTKYTSPITITKNQRVQACLQGDSGQNNTLYYDVTNIDTLAPTMGDAIGSTNNANIGTVSVTGIQDQAASDGSGESGVKGYYIAPDTVTTSPDITSDQWISLNGADSFTYPAANGTYNVWIIDNAGNITGPKSVTVSGVVAPVTSATLGDLSIYVGTTGTPLLSYPTGGSPQSVTYSSSNTGITTIDSSSGLAKGIAAGTSTITATIKNYDGTTVTVTCTVTVQQKVTSATLSGLTLVAGNTGSLTLSVTPTGGLAQSIAYSSSNTGVAIINASGVVTGISAGTATMTATIKNYDGTTVTATSTVTVQTAVAQIGTVYYASLHDAINAVPTTNVPTTVLLLVNATDYVNVSSSVSNITKQNINLNLNGKTLTSIWPSTPLIHNFGTMTISNGIISVPVSGNNNYGVENRGGTLTLSNVTISVSGGTVSNVRCR